MDAIIVVIAVIIVGGPLLILMGLWGWARKSPEESGRSHVFQMVFGTAWSASLVGFVYWLSNQNFSKGRVLRVGNRARLARRSEGSGWNHSEVDLDVAHLSERERAVLGELWLLSARMEHASVAAFSKLSLRLMELGAPAELLRRTHEAALDEVRHATSCFEVARAISGRKWNAGPLPELAKASKRSRRSRVQSLNALAVGSLRDGAFAEGLAASVAAEAEKGVGDEALRAVLQEIGRDEHTHAELGWDIAQWCLQSGADPECLEQALDTIDGDDDALPPIPGVSADVLRQYGVLSQERLGALRTEALIATKKRVAGLLHRQRLSRVA